MNKTRTNGFRPISIGQKNKTKNYFYDRFMAKYEQKNNRFNLHSFHNNYQYNLNNLPFIKTKESSNNNTNLTNYNNMHPVYREIFTLNNGFKWPSDVDEWFIGQGKDIFQADKNKRSDVGYSIQLNYGGICYLLILYGLIIGIFKNMSRYKIDTFFPLFFAASLMLLNYKANILSNSGYFRMVMMFYFVLVLCRGNNVNVVHYKSQVLT